MGSGGGVGYRLGSVEKDMFDSWLSRTRQTWKLVVLLPVAPVSLPAAERFITASVVVPPCPPRFGLFATLVASALAVLLAPAAWFFLAIRCRRCGARPVLWVATHAPFTQTGAWLLHLPRCPRCGDDGTSDARKGGE